MDPRWRRIVMHHSKGPDDVVRMSLEAIRKFHTDPEPAGRGWSDIAYHNLVESIYGMPEAFVGRPLTKDGSHAPGANHDGIGICIVGDFDLAQPGDEILQVVAKRLVAPYVQIFRMDFPACLVRHDQVTPGRTCPGAKFDMARLRGFVAAELGYVT